MTDEMNDDWYTEMAAAVSARKHALAGISRWEASLARAEKEIADLAARRPGDTPTHTAPAPITYASAPQHAQLDPSTVA